MTDTQAFATAIERPDHPFADTLAFIEANYEFTASGFQNGDLRNEADQNQGSCKVLALAELAGFSSEQALKCFGEHYRDVVASPQGDSHQNIRQLQQHGLDAVRFDAFPLVAKQES